MTLKRIGILTSGGDCGGLNAVIKGAAEMALAYGIEAVAIPGGYAGLYNLATMDSVVALTRERLEQVSIGLAGSETGHSRVSIKKIKDPNPYERIMAGLKKHGIDALVISGGNDTGAVMMDLARQGVKCVHAPKTMDLDLVPYSVGGDSTVNRIREFVRDLRTTGKSHNRILIVEVFGRDVGHTAFRSGIAAEADAILIPEVPVDFPRLYRHVKETYFGRIRRSDIGTGTYIILVAEGIRDASGQPLIDKSAGVDALGNPKLAGAGKYVRQELEALMKADPDVLRLMKERGMYVPGIAELPEVRILVPEHLVRCGFTTVYDANFGLEVGSAAVLLLLKGISGVTVIGHTRGEISYMPTGEAIEQRKVRPEQVALYEQLGFFFGREAQPYSVELKETHGTVPRVYD
jgi:6-phosphofructokinase 1